MTSQRARGPGDPIKPPEVPHGSRTQGLQASSCRLGRDWLLSWFGGPAGRGRLLWLEECSQYPVLTTFTPPQPLGLWLCGKKSTTEAPIGDGWRGRVMTKGSYFPSCLDFQGPCLRKPKERPLEVPTSTTPSGLVLQRPGGREALSSSRE